jgi:hypothetical protein
MYCVPSTSYDTGTALTPESADGRQGGDAGNWRVGLQFGGLVPPLQAGASRLPLTFRARPVITAVMSGDHRGPPAPCLSELGSDNCCGEVVASMRVEAPPSLCAGHGGPNLRPRSAKQPDDM